MERNIKIPLHWIKGSENVNEEEIKMISKYCKFYKLAINFTI